MSTTAGAGIVGVLDPTVRDRIRRNRAVLIVGSLVVVVSALLAWAAAGARTGYLDPDSPDPSGARALAQLLREQGVDVVVVRRADEVAAAVGPPGGAVTLAVAGPVPVAPQVARVLAGATPAAVVLVDPTPDALAALAPGATTSYGEGSSATLEPGCTDAVASRAGRLVVSTGITISAAGATTCYRPGLIDEAGRPSVGGVLAVLAAERGRPATAVLGDGTVLANTTLADEGNAALGLGLLGAQPRLVWYVPTIADPALSPSGRAVTSPLDLLPDWVPIVAAQLLLAGIVLAWARGRRLGPVVTEPLPVVVRAAESTQGRARLYRRGRSRDHAATALRRRSLRRASVVLGLPRGSTVEVVAPLVAARTGRSGPDVAVLLAGPPPSDDAALVRLADDLDALDQEVRRP